MRDNQETEVLWWSRLRVQILGPNGSEVAEATYRIVPHLRDGAMIESAVAGEEFGAQSSLDDYDAVALRALVDERNQFEAERVSLTRDLEDAVLVLRRLLSYTEACEGVLNAAPSGQVVAARDLLVRLAATA